MIDNPFRSKKYSCSATVGEFLSSEERCLSDSAVDDRYSIPSKEISASNLVVSIEFSALSNILIYVVIFILNY
jgi:hypothetical protein